MPAFDNVHTVGRVHSASASDLNIHEPSIAPVALPDQVTPDLNGFLNDNLGGHGNANFPGGNNENGFGSGFGNGNLSGPGMPDQNGTGHDLSGLDVPDGINLGGNLAGLGVPDGINLDGNLTGLGVPDGISLGGSLTGLGVPNDLPGSGSNGGGIFGPDGFQNDLGTDAPGDGPGTSSGHGLGGALSNAWTSLSHGDVGDAAMEVGAGLMVSGTGWVDRGIDNASPGGVVVGLAMDAAGLVIGGAGGVATLEQNAATAVVEAGVDTVKQADGEVKDLVSGTEEKAPDQPKPADPKPDNPDTDHYGQGNQPVDDSGTGPVHPNSNGAQLPVDDTGTGPVHPMTSINEQPVDDTGGMSGHPSTHLADMPIDDTGTGPVHPLTASLAGQSIGASAEVGGVAASVTVPHANDGAGFWDQAAQTVGADSENAAGAQTGVDLSAPNASNEHAAVNDPSLTASGLSMSELGAGHEPGNDHGALSEVHSAQPPSADVDAGSAHTTAAAHPIGDLHSGLGTQITEHAFHM